ncbi:MAG: hypothetical protein JOZ51_07870 [Chloroflexi bacterium]|nr:hypothetical protein [Chloroflexota bacterium]
MRNYTFYTFILSGLLVVAGLVCALALNTKITLTCVRGMDDKCVLSSVGKFSSTSREIKLSNISAAKVETHTAKFERSYRRSYSHRTTYVVALITKQGSIPLNEGTSYWNEDLLRTANQINAFLGNRGQSSLQVVQKNDDDGKLWGMILAMMGFVLGRFSLRSEDLDRP